MSSYRQLLYHLVFRTKDSLPTIKQNHVDQLYAYISGIIKHKNSHLYRINGVENHLHILTILFSSFRAVQVYVVVTPGCTGGYSDTALSEPGYENIVASKCLRLSKSNIISS